METGQNTASQIKDIETQPLEIVSQDGDVTLRELTEEDAKEVFEVIDSSRNHLSQPGDDTAQKYPTYESVLESIKNPPNPKRLRFSIRNREGKLVGSINLTPDRDNPKRGEIGYYLGEVFTGKGYATKSLKALTESALSNLGYTTLYGNVVKGNDASIRVLQRIGYTETGRHANEHGLTEIEFSRHK